MTFLASSVGSSSGSGSKGMVPLLVTGAAAAACSYIITKKLHSNDRSKNILNDRRHSVTVTLPDWAVKELAKQSKRTFATDEEMMELPVLLSARNVKEGTGGPFGCAIFERISPDQSKLISIGINRVVPLSNSTLHGETVAIQLAQNALRSFTLQIPKEGECTECPNESSSMRKFELFTSCEPCAMCLGATLWSGVSRIVCGATKSDAERIGFNEGPVFEASYRQLEEAGISVTKLVLREEAAKVLEKYGREGLIYNSSASVSIKE